MPPITTSTEVERPAEDVSDSRVPTPGLAQVERLAAIARDVGVQVTVEIDGHNPDVPLTVDHAAYRILQESMTNVVCHATAIRATIVQRYRDDTDANVYDAFEAGASGFLLNEAGPAELLNAIHVVAAGHALLAPSITRRLIAQFTAAGAAKRTADPGRTHPPRTGRLLRWRRR